jgi:anthranilate phosphoribosyltransferase
MRKLLEDVLEGKDLDEGQAWGLLEELTDPETDPVLAGALLAALRAKGETAAELRGFALGLRERAVRPPIAEFDHAVDIVGTGGDRSGSLNLSTGAALLTAACGYPVIKHGNRSVSSISGSADLLAALGLDIPLAETDAARCLREIGFTFLFAPYYHPAMKSVAPVRKALGVRTIFNMVGPLANPASPPYHLIGAFSLPAARLIAEALSGMPLRRAFVVHGTPGWDEPTPIGTYHLIEVTPGRTQEWVEDPLDFGIGRCAPSDLSGWDAGYNAMRLRHVFEGELGPHRDALILGTSLALRVTGKAADPSAGLAEAEAAIDEGKALSVLESLSRFGSEDRVDHV